MHAAMCTHNVTAKEILPMEMVEHLPRGPGIPSPPSLVLPLPLLVATLCPALIIMGRGVGTGMGVGVGVARFVQQCLHTCC